MPASCPEKSIKCHRHASSSNRAILLSEANHSEPSGEACNRRSPANASSSARTTGRMRSEREVDTAAPVGDGTGVAVGSGAGDCVGVRDGRGLGVTTEVTVETVVSVETVPAVFAGEGLAVGSPVETQATRIVTRASSGIRAVPRPRQAFLRTTRNPAPLIYRPPPPRVSPPPRHAGNRATTPLYTRKVRGGKARTYGPARPAHRPARWFSWLRPQPSWLSWQLLSMLPCDCRHQIAAEGTDRGRRSKEVEERSHGSSPPVQVARSRAWHPLFLQRSKPGPEQHLHLHGTTADIGQIEWIARRHQAIATVVNHEPAERPHPRLDRPPTRLSHAQPNRSRRGQPRPTPLAISPPRAVGPPQPAGGWSIKVSSERIGAVAQSFPRGRWLLCGTHSGPRRGCSGTRERGGRFAASRCPKAGNSALSGRALARMRRQRARTLDPRSLDSVQPLLALRWCPCITAGAVENQALAQYSSPSGAGPSRSASHRRHRARPPSTPRR